MAVKEVLENNENQFDEANLDELDVDDRTLGAATSEAAKGRSSYNSEHKLIDKNGEDQVDWDALNRANAQKIAEN